MQNTNVLKLRLEARLCEAIDELRPLVLDPVEQQIGGEPAWKFVRLRLLNCLGDRGLRGKIKDILDSEISSELSL